MIMYEFKIVQEYVQYIDFFFLYISLLNKIISRIDIFFSVSVIKNR
jgi:hypothetical protein